MDAVRQAARSWAAGDVTGTAVVAAVDGTCSKSKFDWVGRRFKNDRNGCSRRFRCERRHSAARCNHCDLSMNQFVCQCRQAIVMAISPTVLDHEVLTFDQIGFAQASPKCSRAIGVGLRRAGTEESDHRHCRLLRARGERPSRRAAEQGDEIAPPHGGLPQGQDHRGL